MVQRCHDDQVVHIVHTAAVLDGQNVVQYVVSASAILLRRDNERRITAPHSSDVGRAEPGGQAGVITHRLPERLPEVTEGIELPST